MTLSGKERGNLEISIHSALNSVLVTKNRYVISLGGFGEVRKCSNKKTGAIRAVKIIKKESLDAKDKQRFFTEIEVMR